MRRLFSPFVLLSAGVVTACVVLQNDRDPPVHPPVIGYASDTEILTGPVTHVRDGDTIEVSRRPIRLQGLTCDERGTPLGDAATSYVARLIAGERMICELTGDRSYDREIGRCAVENGPDLAAHLIREGICGRFAHFDREGRYLAAERAAGPWRGSMPG